VRHLVEGLVIEPADAGVTSDGLVVQHVAAVADGVDRDGASCSVQMTRNLGQVSTGVAARALLVQRDGLQQLPWEMTVQSPVPGNSPRVTWARGTVPHSDQPREQQVSIVWC
jgi:hypothetical protein